MAGPGNRPPWYVFVLAALGVLLVLTAIIGIGPRGANTLFPFTEPIPQPYRGPGVPSATPSLGDPTSVAITTSSGHRAIAAPPVAGPPTGGNPTTGATGPATTATTATTAPPTTTTPGRSTVTIVFPDPGSGGYCCQDGGGGYGGGGGDGGGGHHR